MFFWFFMVKSPVKPTICCCSKAPKDGPWGPLGGANGAHGAATGAGKAVKAAAPAPAPGGGGAPEQLQIFDYYLGQFMSL